MGEDRERNYTIFVDRAWGSYSYCTVVSMNIISSRDVLGEVIRTVVSMNIISSRDVLEVIRNVVSMNIISSRDVLEVIRTVVSMNIIYFQPRCA